MLNALPYTHIFSSDKNFEVLKIRGSVLSTKIMVRIFCGNKSLHFDRGVRGERGTKNQETVFNIPSS